MSVLIFGGNGLIGSHLARTLLDCEVPVTIAGRRQPSPRRYPTHPAFVECDVRSLDAVKNAYEVAQPSKVVHLAAALQFACAAEPSVAVETNIRGTNNVLTCATQAQVERIVLASSVAVYGDSSGRLQESTPPALSTSLYGWAKRFEERLGEQYSDRFGIQFLALRYSGVFGPGAIGSAGMAMIRAQLEGTWNGAPATVTGASGLEKVQLTYVKDAIQATVLALDAPAPKHQVYNVAGPEENYLSLQEYHNQIRDLFPGAGKVTFSGQARSAGSLDITRIREDLGYVPRYTVKEGLCDMCLSD